MLLTGINGIAQLITVAVLFILVLALTYFTTRFVGRYQKGQLSGNNIQVIDMLRLSQNKLVQIVRVGEKYFAVAVCKDTVTLLGEIDGDKLVIKEQGTASNMEFENLLKRFRKKEQENRQGDR
jgi:flagellar protein FliO/FliZ